MPDDVKPLLGSLIKEAKELRTIKFPSAGAPPEAFYNVLLTVRANLDRMEELLSRAMQAHTWARGQEHSMADTAQDAWDHAAGQDAARAAYAGQDYESAKERHARINLKVLPATKVAREAARQSDLCRYAVDQIRLLYQGLDGVRRDIHRVLSYFPLESNLER